MRTYSVLVPAGMALAWGPLLAITFGLPLGAAIAASFVVWAMLVVGISRSMTFQRRPDGWPTWVAFGAPMIGGLLLVGPAREVEPELRSLVAREPWRWVDPRVSIEMSIWLGLVPLILNIAGLAAIRQSPATGEAPRTLWTRIQSQARGIGAGSPAFVVAGMTILGAVYFASPDWHLLELIVAWGIGSVVLAVGVWRTMGSKHHPRVPLTALAVIAPIIAVAAGLAEGVRMVTDQTHSPGSVAFGWIVGTPLMQLGLGLAALLAPVRRPSST